MGIVIGIIVVLAVAALFAVLTCKSKNPDLFKWIGIAMFIALCLTWVLPYGYFSDGEFVEYGMQRLGLSDVSTLLYYAVYFCLTTLLYFFAIGGFYGVASKTKAYDAIVKKLAKLVKGKELVTTIILTVLLVALTSITKTPLAMLVFVPFLVSVLDNAKFDRMTVMSVTFGSILVGVLAATYGTEGLTWFNSYIGIDYTTGLTYRLILGGIFLALFLAFNILRVLKMTKGKKALCAEVEDPFVIEEVKGKVKMWPTITILAFIAVLVILGFIPWADTFGIECFSNFHTWLTELTLGEDFTIFSYILGTGAVAFGSFEITTLLVILLIASVVMALVNNMKLADFMNNYAEGFAKMLKPVCLYTLAYFVFIVAYMTPYIPFISNWIWGLTKSFNPYLNTVLAFITSLFHADLGYTGYLVGSTVQTNFAANFDLVHTLYVSTYGLVQLFMPTSGLLLLALAYLKIDYKSWFKYIWMFAVAALVVLLIFETVVTYWI